MLFSFTQKKSLKLIIKEIYGINWRFSTINFNFWCFLYPLNSTSAKKGKADREMLNNLRRGDKIITSGGIIGTINKVADNRELQVQVSENVEIKIPRMIADLYTSTEIEKNNK